MPANLNDIVWEDLLKGNYHPSPRDWSDHVFYFFLIDRFSDGNEGVPAGTPLYSPGDQSNAIQSDTDAANWRAAGATWLGGTLQGARSKIGYLQRLGVTALWVSPVLRQRPGAEDYHGYGAQNFLEVDPHFGTVADLRALVDDAHSAGIQVILDIVLNHSGDVFGYAADRYDTEDPQTHIHFMDPRWDGGLYPVAGWRDGTGNPVLAFPDKVSDTRSAVWPGELQGDGVFTRQGHIANWSNPAEYLNGDFFGYKDIHHGSGPVDSYQPSAALEILTGAYAYWLAVADLDGFRVDTAKHMDAGALRYFTSAIHEFAQSLGKDSFFLVGEITLPRTDAIALMDTTGLDAAIGLDGVQDKLEYSVKGWTSPEEYFTLFANSYQVEKESHAWFRDHVLTSYDDHDQVRKGDSKARFASSPDGRALELAVLGMNATTLGVPCIYYGSEQCFDGSGGNDRYIREAMFGGRFGPFRSRDRHAFDETGGTYTGLAAVLAIRKQELALRRGRQYLRQISDDGSDFWFPRRIGPGRMTSIVAWSRIMADRELVCAINTDCDATRSAWVTIDSRLHRVGDGYTYAYSTDAGKLHFQTAAQARNGLAIEIEVPPAGFVILAPA